MSQKRYEEAEPLSLEAVRIMVTAVGKRHPKTQKIMNSYVDLLRELSRQDEAAALLSAQEDADS